MSTEILVVRSHPIKFSCLAFRNAIACLQLISKYAIHMWMKEVNRNDVRRVTHTLAYWEGHLEICSSKVDAVEKGSQMMWWRNRMNKRILRLKKDLCIQYSHMCRLTHIAGIVSTRLHNISYAASFSSSNASRIIPYCKQFNETVKTDKSDKPIQCWEYAILIMSLGLMGSLEKFILLMIKEYFGYFKRSD